MIGLIKMLTNVFYLECLNVCIVCIYCHLDFNLNFNVSVSVSVNLNGNRQNWREIYWVC